MRPRPKPKCNQKQLPAKKRVSWSAGQLVELKLEPSMMDGGAVPLVLTKASGG
jgi:hypothetical protein